MLVFSYQNGLWKAKRGDEELGQARTLTALLENACGSTLPEPFYWHAAEVIESLYGPLRDSHGQIATREP